VPPRTAVLQGPPIPALNQPKAALHRALAEPIGSRPLRAIAAELQPESVVITMSDITRPVPNELLITGILAELNAVGVDDTAVTILIATGMHRPSTPAERDAMLGPDLQRRCRVVDHEADRAEQMVRVCDDPPVSVNRIYAETKLKIVTGLIEPHFMAGYSGGRKGICPGLVDLETVQRFHGHRTMADANSVEGKLDGNPCHAEAMRVAKSVGCDFLVNVALTHDRQPAGIYAGDMVQAHLAGCRDVEDWTTVIVDQPYDLVITSAGGYPLDANFYQTVKGMVTALPALHTRSTLVICSACREIGSPEYQATMRKFGHDWRGFLKHIADSGRTIKDQWQYQMHCRVLDRIGPENLYLAGDGLPVAHFDHLAVQPVGLEGTVQQRLQRFVDTFIEHNRDARIAVIPEGPYTSLNYSPLN
jgi:nickel-dependent lactate racemase